MSLDSACSYVLYFNISDSDNSDSDFYVIESVDDYYIGATGAITGAGVFGFFGFFYTFDSYFCFLINSIVYSYFSISSIFSTSGLSIS